MTNSGFRLLLQRASNVAADNADAKVGQTIARPFLIELHAPGSSARLVRSDEALNHINLGQGRFYRMIDVAIKEVSAEESVAFVRVSGHKPDHFNTTWDPAGPGPFKQILAANLVDRRVHGD
jgi:hypothetical protein